MMLFVGGLHLVMPQTMMNPAGIALTSTNHFHVVRAAYGGAYLGIALLFLAGVLKPQFQRESLLAVAILFSGFALGRVYSIASDGIPAPLYLAVLVFEVTFAVLAALSLRGRSPS